MKAEWQLPPGVSRATWDYVSDERIATHYDAFHASHGLLRYDQQFVNKLIDHPEFTVPKTVVDLGCGTGRSLQRAFELGHQIVGVDLSRMMLDCATAKYQQLAMDFPHARPPQWIEANIVETEFLGDKSADLILCLYSSFGMIRGRKHRQRCLLNVARVLRPDGHFVLHVHNRTNWWTTTQGRVNLFNDWQARWTQRGLHEPGDRYYPYRNLPQMFLHIFTKRELASELKTAGLRVTSWTMLNQSSDGPLRSSRFFPCIRAAGFIVTARPVNKCAGRGMPT